MRGGVGWMGSGGGRAGVVVTGGRGGLNPFKGFMCVNLHYDSIYRWRGVCGGGRGGVLLF